MTSLKKLIANNMKEQRRILGISQAVLAERVDTSTHYIAMIELERKTIPPKSLKEMQKTVLNDIEKAVNKVIHEHVKLVEDRMKDTAKK